MHLVVATSFGGEIVRVALAIAIAAAITAVSLRLLGLRRGWPKALLAGVIGWGCAGLLALGLADWDWGADGLAVHTVAIGIPATMAAAVTLDLLARPGTLATGERAGLIVVPRPFRAVRRRVDVLRRYRELLQLARREGFGPLLSTRGRIERSTEATGVRLRRLLEDAGGVSVKLGQIAATRVDLDLTRTGRRAGPAPEPCPTRGGRADPAGPRGRARTTRRRGVLGVRLGMPRRGLDRPDLPRPAPHRRAGGGEGPAARHRGRHGAGPRRPRAGGQPGAAPDRVRAEHAVRRGARPVRPQPASRARLPPRGRRHGRDADPAGAGLGRAHPSGPQGAVHPPPARAGAVRGLHGRRRRGAGGVGVRPCRAGRRPAALDAGADPHASGSSTPIRTRATCSCSKAARSA